MPEHLHTPRACPFCGTTTGRVDTYYWRCPSCAGVFGDVSRAQSRNLVHPEWCDCETVDPADVFRYELVERPQLSMHQAGISKRTRRGAAHAVCRRVVRPQHAAGLLPIVQENVDA